MLSESVFDPQPCWQRTAFIFKDISVSVHSEPLSSHFDVG